MLCMAMECRSAASGVPKPSIRLAHHAPRSLSGLAREEDEHGDEREFTECIAAWQETGGRTFPDFGRIVSRSPGHSHRSQDVEVRGELNVGGSLFRTTPSTLRKARSKIRETCSQILHLATLNRRASCHKLRTHP
ncbi:unnamed protein product [Durusdinium trenchii]|uniref:Uncharacterized protein n=2 Tax=Durusdinium trenchii TaxID=1381693 RepID=A0ABP0NHS6_9DINO